MKFASRAKKVGVIAGVVAIVAAVTASAYLATSDKGAAVLDTLSSVVNPAKAMSKQIAVEDVKDTDYISPSKVAVTSDGTYAFVNDETAQKVYRVVLASNTKDKEISLDAAVNGVVVNGNDVYVLYGGLDGKVAKYNLDLEKQGNDVSVGHTPVEGVIKGTDLYVANRFSNDVTVINTATMTAEETVEVSREPMSMVLVGDNIYVACHLQDDKATAKTVASKVCKIDAENNVSNIQLTNGAEGVKDICASPDGKYLYVTHILARYGYPTTQLDRGWINTNAVSIIDAENDTLVNSVLLDHVDLGSGNPWGIEATEDKLIVSIAGTQEAVIIDRVAMHNKIKAVEDGETVVKTLTSADRIPDYVNFLDGVRTTVNLTGQNPRDMAVYGDKAYFAQYISGDVAVLDLTNNTTSTISLGEQAPQDTVRRGEALWNDATKCYQNWESCASCHPDARMDSINWDNLNDGLGNPKSAKSMIYSHRTPPTMITGIRASAEIAVRAGMKYIQFNTLSEEENSAIDDYLRALQPVQSPALQKNGKLTADAEAGKEIFDASCASCHPAPLFTDLKKHEATHDYDLSKTDDGKLFDTPSLVEVWRTGPYGINGSYATILDYIKAETKVTLSDDEARKLAAYVESIGNENEVYALEQVLIDDLNYATTHNSYKTANRLIKNSRINSITFRRQLNATTDATATFKLCKANGDEILTKTVDISKDQNKRKVVSLAVDYTVPADLENGSYYTITITEKGNANNALATPFKAVVE